MIKLFYIALILCSVHVNGQSTFEYRHNGFGNNEPFDIAEIDNSLIVVGQSSQPFGESNFFLMRLDQKGSLIWEKEIDSSSSDNYRTVIGCGDDFFCAGRSRFASLSKKVLSKFDLEGNLIWNYNYGFPSVLAYDNQCWSSFHNPTTNNIWVGSSGYSSVTSSTDAELLVLSSDGDSLSTFSYSTDTTGDERIDLAKKIVPYDSGLLLLIESIDANNIAHPFILKIQNDGSEIWRKELLFYNSTTSLEDSLIQFHDFEVTDDTIVCYFTREGEQSSLNTKDVFILFDASGTEISYSEKSESFGLSNGNLHISQEFGYILVGQRDLDSLNNLYFQYSVNVYSKDFQLLEYSNYGESDQNEIYRSSIITGDGGIAVAGRYFNATDPPAKFESDVIKLDCRGKSEWDAGSCYLPESIDLKVDIYPNPFSEYIQIHLSNPVEKDRLQYEVYNLHGQIILKGSGSDYGEVKVSTESMNGGVYVLKVTYLGDTIFTEKVIKF